MLERRSPLPLYLQLKHRLHARIESGEWRPGTRVPGDQAVMHDYGVSRTTVRQAFRELELEGLVTRQRGRGTFVAAQKLPHGPDARHRLSDSLVERGLAPGWRLLECAETPAPPPVAARLAIRPGAPVLHSRRVRLASGEPIGVLEAHALGIVPARFDPALLVRGQSLDYLAATGPFGRIDRTLEALPADEAVAKDVGVPVGTAMLRVRRLVHGSDGRPVEDLCATYRGDRFQYFTRAVPAADPR